VIRKSISLITHHLSPITALGGEEMKEFLSKMVGRRIDIFCGGASSLRGEVVKVEGGVLQLKDDDGQMCYVAIEKIAVVWEAREDEKRAGFVAGPLNNTR
jgi:hypothetical protein